MRKWLTFATAIATVTLPLAACGVSGAEPGAVTFDIELIEVKGATDGITAPAVDPAGLSAGYRFKAPGDYDADNPEKWQVSTYMFSPGAMSAIQGDEVTPRMFGVNGDNHDVWVEAPDGSIAAAVVNIQRGREVTVSFTADQAGHYKLLCGTHAPTMQRNILSIPG